MKNCLLIFLSLAILSLAGCNSHKVAKDYYPAARMDRYYEEQGFVKAVVKKYDIDGCGFMLFLTETKKLNPNNLDEKFKKEGLKVWIKYTVDKKAMSICMAGENITITEIELVNE